MSAIRKVTGELLIKQAYGKENLLNSVVLVRKRTIPTERPQPAGEVSALYTKNMYILKLLLNVVTAGIEALVLGNKFLYACVKEVCRL
jgi:hypothetical protein